MTTYYQPLRLEAGGWHYTCTNGAGTFPLGYCCHPVFFAKMFVPWEETSESTKLAYMTKERYDQHLADTLPFRAKYHTAGHETADDAIRCYHQYLVDQCLMVHESQETQHKCQECGTWTPDQITFRGETLRHLILCPACRRPDLMLKHLWVPYQERRNLPPSP